MTPQRIQRRRTKGWRMPEGAVYVGRPSRWGNPFVIHSEEILVHEDGRDWYCPLESGGARQAAVDMFAMWVSEAPRLWIAQTELAGHDLACWCPLEDAEGNRVPCHADVLSLVAALSVRLSVLTVPAAHARAALLPSQSPVGELVAGEIARTDTAGGHESIMPCGTNTHVLDQPCHADVLLELANR